MTPAHFLPGRYVINYDVPNPLTCRHKHACACHGQQAKPQTPKPKEKESDVEEQFIDLAGRLAFALRPFPEAREAADQVVANYLERRPT